MTPSGKNTRRLLFLPGDGIGPEIMAQVSRMLEWLDRRRGLAFAIEEDLIGGAAIDAHGTPIRESTMTAAHSADAILFGAVGGPRWDLLPFDERPERGILRIRKEVGLFGNIRVAKVYDALVSASPLRRDLIEGLDIIILRENTGGMYFGTPRGIKRAEDGSLYGINTHLYTEAEIRRVARLAFELAKGRQQRVCSVDKANVMETGELWRRIVQDVHDREYPGIELTNMYADNCAMQLVRRPSSST